MSKDDPVIIRPPKRLARVAATVAVAAALLGLVQTTGHASIDPGNPPPPPPPPKVTIDLPDLVAWEKPDGDCPPVHPTVGLSHVMDVPVAVSFATADGTARAPDDYTAVTGVRVTIPAGALSVAVPVQIKADAVKEPDEFFTAMIFASSVGTIEDGLAVVTVMDGAPPRTC